MPIVEHINGEDAFIGLHLTKAETAVIMSLLMNGPNWDSGHVGRIANDIWSVINNQLDGSLETKNYWDWNGDEPFDCLDEFINHTPGE